MASTSFLLDKNPSLRIQEASPVWGKLVGDEILWIFQPFLPPLNCCVKCGPACGIGLNNPYRVGDIKKARDTYVINI